MIRTPQYRVESKLIASLSPIDLPAIGRPYGFIDNQRPVLDRRGNPTGFKSYGGWAIYRMPGVGYDKAARPHVISIQDGFQHGIDATTRQPEASPQFVQSEDIVADLLNHWKTGLAGAGQLSLPVWECSDPEGPTEEEIEMNRNMLLEYCRFLYNEGNRLSAEHKHIEIHPQHRMGGLYLGKEDDWLKAYRPDDKFNCPVCEAPLSKTASLCAKCNTIFKVIDHDLQRLNPHLRDAGYAQRERELVGASK